MTFTEYSAHIAISILAMVNQKLYIWRRDNTDKSVSVKFELWLVVDLSTAMAELYIVIH